MLSKRSLWFLAAAAILGVFGGAALAQVGGGAVFMPGKECYGTTPCPAGPHPNGLLDSGQQGYVSCNLDGKQTPNVCSGVGPGCFSCFTTMQCRGLSTIGGMPCYVLFCTCV